MAAAAPDPNDLAVDLGAAGVLEVVRVRCWDQARGVVSGVAFGPGCGLVTGTWPVGWLRLWGFAGGAEAGLWAVAERLVDVHGRQAVRG